MPALTIGFCPPTLAPHTRRRSAGCSSRCVVAISLVIAALASLPVTRADVIIDTAVTTEQPGDGGTFTVTSSGSINTPGFNGIKAGSGSGTAITTLTVEGPVTGSRTGVLNDASTIDTLNNSSTITGTGNFGVELFGAATIGSLTNQAAG